MRPWLTVMFLGILASSSPALAQEDPEDDLFGEEDDDLLGGEDEDEPAPEPAREPIPEDENLLEDDEDIEFDDPIEDDEGDPTEGDDLLGDEGSAEDELTQVGVDSSKLYREQQNAMKGMAPDEEVMAWEEYLETYPNSLFRERIATRTDELIGAQFGLEVGESGGNDDADERELLLVSPMQLDNVNPRTRLQIGLEVGIPLTFAGAVDFEYAFLRNVSAHVGVKRRYEGWGLDAGARWGFVKSTRLQLVASASVDLRANVAPQLFFQVRPMIGFGKIFGPVQLLANLGAGIETRPSAGVALFGGAHLSWRVAQPIAVFVEANYYVRQLGRTDGVFTFDAISFGFRLFPKMKKRSGDPVEINAGANMAVATQYLQYYFGSVQAQGNLYFD